MKFRIAISSIVVLFLTAIGFCLWPTPSYLTAQKFAKAVGTRVEIAQCNPMVPMMNPIKPMLVNNFGRCFDPDIKYEYPKPNLDDNSTVYIAFFFKTNDTALNIYVGSGKYGELVSRIDRYPINDYQDSWAKLITKSQYDNLHSAGFLDLP